MTNRIRRTTRKVSKAGRRAQGAAGAANLARWQADQQADVRVQVELFESELLASIGETPTPEQRALALVATASYGVLLRTFRRYIRARRVRFLPAVLDAIPRLQGHLARSLAALRAGQHQQTKAFEEQLAEIASDIVSKRERRGGNDGETQG